MSLSDIHGDSQPASNARVGQMIEVEGIRMQVTDVAEDRSRICHDRMAHRIWRIPAGARCLIVEPKC